MPFVGRQGAYSFKDGFDAIAKSGGKPSIPVRGGTTLARINPSPGQILRNELLQDIWDAGGRIAWKKTSGHHRHSLVETHIGIPISEKVCLEK